MFIKQNKQRGFTLMEVLVALLIFSVIALVMSVALRRVMDAESGTNTHAVELRELQRGLLILSRDVEQVIDRPIRVAKGGEGGAFVGKDTSFELTRTGVANQLDANAPLLQRVGYIFENHTLYRERWAVLDQAPSSKPARYALIENIDHLKFEYLDKDNRFYDHWPLSSQGVGQLPRAVKITFTVPELGTMSQLYVIPVQTNTAPPKLKS